MDRLINALGNLGFTGDEEAFDNCLDSIIENMNNGLVIFDEDSDREWEIMCENYSKIKWIMEHYIFNEKFNKIVSKFLDSMDKTTQRYLKVIEWECAHDDDLDRSYKNIQKNLQNSLNAQNIVARMGFLVLGYSEMIPIVEDFRNEKASDQILDPEFIKNFDIKRRKKT
jgi:hypothetical protein